MRRCWCWAAIVTVYIVLGVLYESYIHPITILSTLPSAAVGALLALLLTKSELTVVAIIGIVLLIGIVEKNAIMMIDFALEAERVGGKQSYEAIFQACLLRFRPILMTTMAALLGAVPLALGTGYGAELRRPLGITIIGGLIFSQMLTLYTTPVIYLFFDDLARKLAAFRERYFSSGRAPPRQRPPGTNHESFFSFHRAARRHHAAHRCDGPGGRRGIFPAARFAAASGRLPHHLGVRRASRRQSRDHWRPRWPRRSSASSAASRSVSEMTSSSTLGQTTVTLQFSLDRNIDAAARDVEAAINAARGYLPTDLPANPTYRKVNPADAPIMIVSLTSNKLSPGRFTMRLQPC